jgi:hypothetical protein
MPELPVIGLFRVLKHRETFIFTRRETERKKTM